MRKIIQIKLNYLFYFLLALVSGLSSIYYGFIGINPIDNFTIYNTGYYLLNGYIPFKDFWVVTGPFLDLFQLFIFKIFGVNWLSYTFHSAFFNIIFVLSSYFVFKKFKLDTNYAFTYSLFLSLISYTQVGTPFVDHHATILCLIGLNFFILAIKTNENKYWVIFPLVFFLALLSKQTPSSYFILFLAIIIALNFFKKNNFKNIVCLITSCTFSLFLLIFYLKFYNIDFKDFYNQYFLFASSVGKERLNAEFLFPIEFSRYFLKFKLIHLSCLPLIFILLKNIFRGNLTNNLSENIIIISLIFSTQALVIHQLLTLNVKFVYLIIPLLFGYAHIFMRKYLEKINLSNAIIVFCFIFSSYYFFKYVNERKFVISENYFKRDIIVKSKIIDDKFKFNWISNLNPNPLTELNELKRIINFFEQKKNFNYIIVTDYQFIMSKLNSKENIFINKWYHPGVSYPLPDNKNFSYFKRYFIDKIISNKVSEIYFVNPTWFGDTNLLAFRQLLGDCISEKYYLESLVIGFKIKNCF